MKILNRLRWVQMYALKNDESIADECVTAPWKWIIGQSQNLFWALSQVSQVSSDGELISMNARIIAQGSPPTPRC